MTSETLSVHVDGIQEAEWNALVDSFADANVYQTWAYGAVRWGEQQLSHLVLRRRGVVAAIAQVRIVRLPLIGSGIAYLRWGPLWRPRAGGRDTAVLRAVAEALVKEYVVRRKLLLRVIPNVLETDPECRAIESVWSDLGFGPDGAAKPYHTVLVDLRPSPDEIRQALSARWRRQLNIAERNDLEVREGQCDDLYGTFMSLYREMLERKRFDTTVDVAEFERIQRRLPAGQKMSVLICCLAGVPVAGLVVATVGNTAIYLLAATGDSGLTARGSYLLQWRAMMRLKESGHEWYDLGGINQEANPGVFTFKTGMGGIETTQLPTVQLNTAPLNGVAVAVGDGVRQVMRRLGQTARR